MSRWQTIVTATGRLCLIVLGVALLSGGVLKSQDIAGFRSTILSHGLFAEVTATAIASTFPWIEIVVGAACIVCTISAIGRATTATVAAAMFLVFAGYAMWLDMYPPPSPAACGCFGSQVPVESWHLLAMRNGIIASLIALIAWNELRSAQRARAADDPVVS